MTNRKTNGGTTQSTAERERVPQKIQRDAGKPEVPSKARAAKQKTVTVVFNVTVPESTAKLKRPVFLAGTFQQTNNKVADWDTRTHQMKKVDKTHYTINLTGPENAVIEYKYTLGDWDTVERDQHCRDIGNRHVTLSARSGEDLTVNDTVHNWRNVDPCGM